MRMSWRSRLNPRSCILLLSVLALSFGAGWPVVVYRSYDQISRALYKLQSARSSAKIVAMRAYLADQERLARELLDASVSRNGSPIDKSRGVAIKRKLAENHLAQSYVLHDIANFKKTEFEALEAHRRSLAEETLFACLCGSVLMCVGSFALTCLALRYSYFAVFIPALAAVFVGALTGGLCARISDRLKPGFIAEYDFRQGLLFGTLIGLMLAAVTLLTSIEQSKRARKRRLYENNVKST